MYYDSSSESEPEFWCGWSERSFVNYHAKTQHDNAVHARCSPFGRTFINERSKEQHDNAVHPPHQCDICNRSFQNENHLRMHMQVRQPRNTACVGCGKMYKSPADVVAHFETGYCSACKGQDNARRAVYRFFDANGGGNSLVRAIGYGSSSGDGYDPDGDNYCCPKCNRRFKRLDSLMQHQQSRPICRSTTNRLSIAY